MVTETKNQESGQSNSGYWANLSRRDQIQFAIFALSPIAVFPFSEWIATTRIGTWTLLWSQGIYVLPLLVMILGTPVAVACLIFRRTRPNALVFLLVAAIFIPCCVCGVFLGGKIRTAGMKSFAQRSQALIRAIEQYEQRNGAPPEQLADLVPDYLAAVPSTGMMAYPEYLYLVGDEARSAYGGNDWVLLVNTPGGGINFDMMLYLPKQNYPRHGYGGRLDPIADWAYVHE